MESLTRKRNKAKVENGPSPAYNPNPNPFPNPQNLPLLLPPPPTTTNPILSRPSLSSRLLITPPSYPFSLSLQNSLSRICRKSELLQLAAMAFVERMKLLSFLYSTTNSNTSRADLVPKEVPFDHCYVNRSSFFGDSRERAYNVVARFSPSL
ncbi:unnamed protein product [Camellia sinensis]